jgi:hypothetical protein
LRSADWKYGGILFFKSACREIASQAPNDVLKNILQFQKKAVTLRLSKAS